MGGGLGGGGGPEVQVNERRARAAPAQLRLAGHRLPTTLRGKLLVGGQENDEGAERVDAERACRRLPPFEAEHELRGGARGASAGSVLRAETPALEHDAACRRA